MTWKSKLLAFVITTAIDALGIGIILLLFPAEIADKLIVGAIAAYMIAVISILRS